MSSTLATWDARAGILRVPVAAAGGDADGVAAVLIAVQDTLSEAGGRPVVVHGQGRGFVIEGGIDDPDLRRLASETGAAIADHPLPVLAAIDAPLLDSGLELALACDLRFVRRGERVGLPATRRGWLPSGAGQRLVRQGGASLASQLLLLGETPVVGSEPRLDRLLEACDDPATAARAALDELAARGPLALEALKTAIRTADEMPLHVGAAIEADLACLLLDTSDRSEGLDALRERRPPRFRGR